MSTVPICDASGNILYNSENISLCLNTGYIKQTSALKKFPNFV